MDIAILFLLFVISEPVVGSINCPLSTAWNHLKQKLQLSKCVWSVGMSVRNCLDFSWCMGIQATSGGTILRQIVLSCLRKTAKHGQ